MEHKHFSHQHPLTLHKVQQAGQQQLECHGCNLRCEKDSSMFACWSCKFFLHDHCGNAPRHFNHPNHPAHRLVLMVAPTYCSGSFMCTACGSPGSSFSYCCPLCEVDLHLNCAYLPWRLSHNAHGHDLYLALTPETPNTDHCKLCRDELSSKNWSFVCAKYECDFRVHTFCATTEVRPGMYDEFQQEEEQAPAGGGGAAAANQNAAAHEWTPEEMVLEMGRMRMEYGLAQGLANIIAYYPY